jgi:hypothetical protein
MRGARGLEQLARGCVIKEFSAGGEDASSRNPFKELAGISGQPASR